MASTNEAVTAAVTEALRAAADNAAKPGKHTSEFWATLGTIGLAGLAAGAKALAIIPGPWSVVAIPAAAGLLAVTSYNLSRGSVKKAALAAAGATLSAAAAELAPKP